MGQQSIPSVSGSNGGQATLELSTAAATSLQKPLSTPAPLPQSPYDRGGLGFERKIQQGLNLVLRLKNPAQMPALLMTLEANKERTHQALASLRYVHFARFLPTPDMSALQVITEFDGDLKSYVMDFVALMGDIFTAMLEFVSDAPRLPVQQYPNDFWAWVLKNNESRIQPWSAYPSLTVIDIITGCRVPIPGELP